MHTPSTFGFAVAKGELLAQSPRNAHAAVANRSLSFLGPAAASDILACQMHHGIHRLVEIDLPEAGSHVPCSPTVGSFDFEPRGPAK